MTRADKHLVKLGFIKKRENQHVIEYEREDKAQGFVQTVDIVHKMYGPAILQSYDKNLMDTKGIGNTCVGLTEEEAKWFSRKMREYRRKPPKENAV